MEYGNKYRQLAVSQSFINIKGVNDITISGAVGFIDASLISNFTVSRSKVLFEGEGSNVKIRFCMGYNDRNSKCDFDETKKIFDHSPYNDTNGTSHHQYNYNMNLTNQCMSSKLPFIEKDCEIKPEEYRRYKEPVTVVWDNASCLAAAQAITPVSAATVPVIELSTATEPTITLSTEAPTEAPTETSTEAPTEVLIIGVSSAAFIAVAAVGGGFYWYKRHNNGGCCSGHRELSTKDGNNQSEKYEMKSGENMHMIDFSYEVE